MSRPAWIRCDFCGTRAPNSARGRTRQYCSNECRDVQAAILRLCTTMDAIAGMPVKAGRSRAIRSQLTTIMNTVPLPRDRAGRFTPDPESRGDK